MFRPWVVEIDRIFPFTGWKESRESVVEEARLQKEPLTSALRVAGHFYVVNVGKRLNRVGGVFNSDLGKLGGAHLPLDAISQSLLTFGGRLVFAYYFLDVRKVAHVFDTNITFYRAVLAQAKFGCP